MRNKKNGLLGLLFLAPSLLGVCIFVLIPFADVVRRSFRNAMGSSFTGIENYHTVWNNEAFRLAAGNTLRFILVCVPLLLLLSLVCALVISRMRILQEFFKTTFLFPMAIPVASVVLLWRLFLDQKGFFNEAVSFLGLSPVHWMNSESAFGVLVFTYVWKNAGYDIILWLAGLSDIPKERYEAASVDGAGAWKSFLYVTLPGLRSYRS